MEVSWVSLLILFCSCSNAINMKKGNSSILDNFHLLDKLIQQEICKMLKEISASSKFNSNEKTEVSPDLCNHLEPLGNEEVDKDLKIEDSKKSLLSKIDQIASIETNPSPGDQKLDDFLSSTTAQKNHLLPRNAEASGILTVSANSPSPSLSTILKDLTFLEETAAKEMITPLKSKNGTISSDSIDQNSLKVTPSVLNMRELIQNSNTLRPDPTFGNEPNPPNSLEFPAVELMNNSPESSADNQRSTKSDTRLTSYSIIFPSKCGSSKILKIGENVFASNSTSNNESGSKSGIESSTEIKAAVRTDSAKELPGELHVFPDKKKSSSLESASFGENSPRESFTSISTGMLDQCPECSMISKVPSTASDDLMYNQTCLWYCAEKHSTSINNLTSTSKSSTSLVSLQPTLNPIPSNLFHILAPKLSSSSNLSKSSSSASESLDHSPQSSSFLNQAEPTFTKVYPADCTSDSSSSAYHKMLTTPKAESTTDFCATSTIKRYQSINTTSSKTTLKPWCSAVKLTVNPKSPRATRQRTKIYASVGNLHSYAGFFNTDPQDNVRLFFWFFCNRKWKNTPLIVWLQGEPGLSSLHGLFEEHGPYYIKHSKKGVDIKLREFSWVQEYNVLYLDSCVGCGFSMADYEGAHPPTFDNVARDIHEALAQFFMVWHEMKSNDLYLAGSYAAAKYIPVIAHKIHDENAKNNFCSQKMNLKGLIIGGPYANSAVMVNYNDFLLAQGIIDEVTHNEMIPLQYQAQELIRAGKFQDAIDFINIHIYCLISQAGYEAYKDVRVLRQSQDENLRNIFQSDKFKRMICIDENNFNSKTDLLIEEIMPSVDSLMPNLLSHYKVLYYNGQFDLMAPFMLTSKSLLKLEWQSIDRFFTTEMIQWCPYQNGTMCPQGFYKNYQNLTHVMVRDAGHPVGITHSKSLFYLLKWFVEDKFQRYQLNGNWYE